MKIKSITTEKIIVPLTTTFKTALRSISTLENVVVTIETDTGIKGFGSAAPTAVITGETTDSIQGAIRHITTQLVGMDLLVYEEVLQKLNNCIVGNRSAKAAVDMAVFDLVGKQLDIPLYRLFGGISGEIHTDYTISLNPIDEMVAESKEKIAQGYTILKIKVGGDPETDIARLQAIAEKIDSAVVFRIDANQGWKPKEAIYVGNELVKRNIPVELMEQPVKAHDFKGLKLVRDNVQLPVYADESMFTPEDALKLIEMGAIDGLNIKLMKCGGLYNALKIAAIAESAGLPCMIGSMMECAVSVTAAAHLAASKKVITGYDLDAPLFCSFNPAVGGIMYEGSNILFPDSPGLGIEKVQDNQ